MLMVAQRHHFAPSGRSSRYRPPPSRSFCTVATGFALRMAVSVKGTLAVTDFGGGGGVAYRQIYRHQTWDLSRPHRTQSDTKKAETPCFMRVFGLLRTLLDLKMVGPPGFEPGTKGL
ncbi:hypothetical protein XACB100_2010022 [Xanthomonas citri pv. citri]|nr:hypothetical protein XACB100_2010022 [Xanthomonas citri pv. citri]